MRGIGVQTNTHNIVVEGKLSPVSLLLHADKIFTQQSTLDLFIPWSDLSVAMTHGTLLGMYDEMIYFILFLLSRPCLYMLRHVHMPCGK